MIHSWIMLPVLRLSESVVATQKRSADSWIMYIGFGLVWFGLVLRLSELPASPAAIGADLFEVQVPQSCL